MNHEKAKHLADKLLASPVGREVLSKALGGDILSKDPEVIHDRPIVACLVPCYKAPEPRMQEAFIKMQVRSRNECIMFPGPPISMSVVHWSRNGLIAELIKTQKPWTHVLFIDDDIVPPDDALLRMLAHKKDIVGAVCTRRTDPPIPNIRYLEESTGTYREIWSWPENTLLEVGAVGTGMVLISREALNKVADAFWTCKYEREFYQITEEKAQWLQEQRLKYFDESANAFWFRFLTCMEGTFEMGEDVSFCFIATRYCGLKIYVDTSIQPEHIGQYGFSIKDFIPYREQCIAKAKAEGRFKDQAIIRPEGFTLNYEDNLVSA